MNTIQVKLDPDVYIQNPFPKKIRDKDTMTKYLDADERLSNVSMKIEYYNVMLKIHRRDSKTNYESNLSNQKQY